MKNKIKLKKCLIKVLIVGIILTIIMIVLNIYEYHTYTKNFNNKIGSILEVLQEEYPSISESEIIEILNSSDDKESEILTKYSLNLNDKSVIIKNQNIYPIFLTINSIIFLLEIISLIIIFISYTKNRDKEVLEISNYLEELNKRNYELNIDSISEDELSILKTEIYKTTIMLKEASLNSQEDKLNLKKSLEDISHQLKTPLTSILVILDNLIDDIDMDAETRNDFIRDIKREVMNINFLVQAILKLSKFDSNTINFIRKDAIVKDIINESIKNVSILCDLRNIKIDVKGNIDIKLKCDVKWEIEALTNIIKNSIEHSKDNERIEINYSENNVYIIIEIKDYGSGISKKDIKHIFERFYKSENSKEDSIGIGLALAKRIIEEDNGVILVTSDENGTKFIIKYFK